MGRLIAGGSNDTTTQERTLTGVDSSQRNYAQKAPLLWITLWPPSAQRNVPHMNSHPPRPFRRSLLFTPILYHIWGHISNEQFVYKSFELINGIEKRAVTATARSLCLNSLCLKMDRLIAGLLRKLRPQSNKLTGLDRSLFYWRAKAPLPWITDGRYRLRGTFCTWTATYCVHSEGGYGSWSHYTIF